MPLSWLILRQTISIFCTVSWVGNTIPWNPFPFDLTVYWTTGPPCGPIARDYSPLNHCSHSYLCHSSKSMTQIRVVETVGDVLNTPLTIPSFSPRETHSLSISNFLGLASIRREQVFFIPLLMRTDSIHLSRPDHGTQYSGVLPIPDPSPLVGLPSAPPMAIYMTYISIHVHGCVILLVVYSTAGQPCRVPGSNLCHACSIRQFYNTRSTHHGITALSHLQIPFKWSYDRALQPNAAHGCQPPPPTTHRDHRSYQPTNRFHERLHDHMISRY